MENKSKNELGRIYGSRISKSGKYLNLIIAAAIEGKEIKITCPVRIVEDYDGSNNKPVAQIGMKSASIYDVPVFEDSKPKQEAKANEDTAKKPVFVQGDPNDGLPF